MLFSHALRAEADDCKQSGQFCPLFHLLDYMEVHIISKQELLINEEIRDREVRVIGAANEQLGIMKLADALNAAAERNLDLVRIAPNAQPPVCRICDYGKLRFEQAKKEKEAKKNQHAVEVKEIRFSVNIDTHDFEVKAKNAVKFLQAGNKVKVSVRFRGREMAHTSLGNDLLMKFADHVSEYGVLEKAPKMEGRSMSIFLAKKVEKPASKKQEKGENDNA